jgi:putative NADPH-quinone reductase
LNIVALIKSSHGHFEFSSVIIKSDEHKEYDMKKTILIMGHPHPENSLSNKLISETIGKLDNITVNTLTDSLNNGEFDVAAEQKALTEADIIVLQFPFYWFSTPSLLQKWFEDVLLYGFAYGTGGDNLKGKKLVISMTVGGAEKDYINEEHNHIEVLLQPLRALCEFVQLEACKDIISFGMTYVPGVAGDKDDIISRALAHSERLKEALEQL